MKAIDHDGQTYTLVGTRDGHISSRGHSITVAVWHTAQTAELPSRRIHTQTAFRVTREGAVSSARNRAFGCAGGHYECAPSIPADGAPMAQGGLRHQ
jgi:hypothetical protein